VILEEGGAEKENSRQKPINVYGNMTTLGRLCGVSEPRERHLGGIVPAPLGSCLQGKSCVGLPTLFAASSVGEHVIAGLVPACTAGAGINNAPAKDRVVDALSPRGLIDEERGEGFPPPLRLRGGSDKEESPSERGASAATNAATTTTTANLRPLTRGRDIRSPSSDDALPGPSGVRRSRSAARGTRTRGQVQQQRTARRVGSSDEEYFESSDDPDRSKWTLKGKTVEQPIVALEKIRIVDLTTEKDKTTQVDPPSPTKRAGKRSLPDKKEGSSSENTTPSPPKTPPKKKLLGPKSARAARGLITKVEGKRGRGRPITTGLYRDITAAKKAYNDERERELRIEMEARIFDMRETLEILKRSKCDPEESAEKAAMDPTPDLANQIREAQAEVVRISKVSSHLQGPLQKSLREAAALTMGLTDVLRTRAHEVSERTGKEELRMLREQISKLTKEQERTNEVISSLREELAQAREKAETAKVKAKVTKQELQDSTRKNEELKRKLGEERKKNESLRRAPPPQPISDQLGAYGGGAVSTPTSQEETMPANNWARAPPTEQELREYPALRPPIQGRTKRIPDNKRALPPPELIRDLEAAKVSTRRRKGTAGPSWGDMKVFSPVDPDTSLEKRVANAVIQELEGMMRREMSREDTRRVPPSAQAQGSTNRTGGQRDRPLEATPGQRQTRGSVPPAKKRISEARKARKREKRRAKRQEEARRRAGGSPEPRPRRGQGSAPLNADRITEGPAYGTRARTQAAGQAAAKAPVSQPPPTPAEGIRDVPIPPEWWREGEEGEQITVLGRAVAAPTRRPRPTPPPPPPSNATTAATADNKEAAEISGSPSVLPPRPVRRSDETGPGEGRHEEGWHQRDQAKEGQNWGLTVGGTRHGWRG